jgi:hypothetical protein
LVILVKLRLLFDFSSQRRIVPLGEGTAEKCKRSPLRQTARFALAHFTFETPLRKDVGWMDWISRIDLV